MKVVPLMSDEKDLEVAMKSLSLKKGDEEGKEVDGEEEEVDELEEVEEEVEPTWSDPRDVAKEVQLGRLVGELQGFCDLIGYVENPSSASEKLLLTSSR